jgi:hypothetical protein
MHFKRVHLLFAFAVGLTTQPDNLFGAGLTRHNIATALARAGNQSDALEYAQAALRNFEGYGDGARDQLQMVYELIARIERDLRSKAQGRNG